MILTAAEHDLLRSAGLTGQPLAERVAGGFANDVLQVRSGGQRVLLRRWTRDPDSAAVELGALAEAAADGIPVPEVLAAGEDRAVLSWVPGTRADLVLAEASAEQAYQVGGLLGALASQVACRNRGSAGTVRFTGSTAVVEPWPMDGPALLHETLRRVTEGPAGWPEWAARFAPELGSVHTVGLRVHSDLNPKNVLLRPGPDGWQVAALLDWEFTFAGPSEVDIGNLLRFERRDTDPEPFGRGVRDGLGGLSAARLRQARVLDLLALCGFLSPLPPGKPDHPIRQAVHELVAHQLATDRP